VKAEIGFIDGTQRLKLVIKPDSETEVTLVREFSRRTGFKMPEWSTWLEIHEPERP